MNKKDKDFKYFTLVACLICEREMKPIENQDSKEWTHPLYSIDQTNPAKFIMDIMDMQKFVSKKITKELFLCDRHYKELVKKIEKGGEIDEKTRRSAIYSNPETTETFEKAKG